MATSEPVLKPLTVSERKALIRKAVDKASKESVAEITAVVEDVLQSVPLDVFYEEITRSLEKQYSATVKALEKKCAEKLASSKLNLNALEKILQDPDQYTRSEIVAIISRVVKANR